MGAVYEKMKADLKLRRYSARTERSYLYYAARFVRHVGRPPVDLGKTEIRQFLLMLHERGESPASLKLYVASIRFLYAVTLERPAESITFRGRASCRNCPRWSAAQKLKPCSARSSRWSAAWSS